MYSEAVVSTNLVAIPHCRCHDERQYAANRTDSNCSRDAVG